MAEGEYSDGEICFPLLTSSSRSLSEQRVFSKPLILLNRSPRAGSLLARSGKAKKVSLCIFEISFIDVCYRTDPLL